MKTRSRLLPTVLLGGALLLGSGCRSIHDTFFSGYCPSDPPSPPQFPSQDKGAEYRRALEQSVSDFGISPHGKTANDLRTDLRLIADSERPYGGTLLDANQWERLEILLKKEDLKTIREMQDYLEGLHGKTVIVYERQN